MPTISFYKVKKKFMKSNYLFSLTVLFIIAVSLLIFFQSFYIKIQKDAANNCRQNNLKHEKQKNDSSENIFLNPLNCLITAVYK